MIATTNAPFKSPNDNYIPFKAQVATSMAISPETSADSSTAIATTHYQDSTTVFNASLSLREQTLQSAEEALKTMTDVAKLAREQFEKEGFIEAEAKSKALNFALNHQATQAKIHHERQQEVRHYHWEAMKCQMKERRHQENLESAREDKDWLTKLTKARDEAMKSLNTGIQFGMGLAVVGRVGVFVSANYKIWAELSISSLFTKPFWYLTGMVIDQCLSNSSSIVDSSSWLGYASTYVISYVPSMGNMTCVATQISWLLSLLLAAISLGVFLSFFKKFLPSIGSMFETAMLATSLMMASWTFIPWVSIAVTQAVIYIPAYIYLQYLFQKAKALVRKSDEIPSSSKVTKSIATFDEVVQVLQFVPFLILLTSVLFSI